MWTLEKKTAFLAVLHYLNPELRIYPEVKVSWNKVEFHASRNGVLPFLHEAIKSNIALPPSFLKPMLDNWAHQRENILAINLAYISILKQLPDLYTKQDLVLLQGSAYLTTLYPNPSLRPMGDLDIFRNPSNAVELKSALEQLSFKQDIRYCNIFRKGVLTFDLHDEPAGGDCIRSRNLLIQFKNENICDILRPSSIHPALNQFTDETQFVLHSFHCMKHSYSRWIWLLDAALLIKKNQADDFIEKVRKQACAMECRPVVEAMFGVLGNIFSIDPDLNSLRAHELNSMQSRVVKWFNDDAEVDKAGELFFMASITTPGPKLIYLLEIAFPKACILRETMGMARAPLAILYLKRAVQLMTFVFRFIFKSRQADAKTVHNM